MAGFNFESVDIVRFAPVALRQCSKKGHLQELKKGNESSKYFYCLFGNLLYNFEHENDPSSALSLIFLESCTCKIVSIDSQPVLSISTVGGRSINLLSCSSNREELQEWMEAIECYKIKNMTRKLDDSESELLQLQHRSQQHEQEHFEYEQSLVNLRRELKELNDKNNELLSRISQLENEKEDLIRQMKSVDSERLLLLKSRGITPKTLPAWALQERPRKGVSEPLKFLKIWAGTWNLSGKEPFAGMQKDRAKRLLQPFVPDGYDLYVLGVQECTNDSVFECLDALLLNEGCRRIKLEGNLQVDESSASTDPTKIFGRGDGTLQSLKFTGIVIYARMNLLGDVKSCSVANVPFTSGKSKGAVAVALTVFGRTMVFVNAHFESKNNDLRRDQYQNLIMSLGSQLAEPGFHLNEQFNHLVWLGDFNFTLVDTSGNNMPADTVVKMLEDGRVLRTLFETHDQLNQDKKHHLVFYGYREPTPFPNFYPTYRKIEGRAPVNYSSPDWVRNTYRTQVKDSSSFFRSSSTKEIAPGFSDRVLYCSMYDLAEDLVPEALPADMQVKGDEDNNAASNDLALTGRRLSRNPRMDSTVGNDKSNILSLRVDNYRSINDGEGMSASEHSPVFCTFLLRLRHDHGLLTQTANSGDINNLLSALGTSQQSAPAKNEKDNVGSTVDSSLEESTPESSSDAASPAALGRSDSVGGKTVAAKRTWYTSKINKSRERSTSPVRRKSVDQETMSPIAEERFEMENEMLASPSAPLIEKLSLLPHGTYRIRLSEIKLIWGMMEESPINMSLLFPAPYEVKLIFLLIFLVIISISHCHMWTFV
jgi:hypothetical protein